MKKYFLTLIAIFSILFITSCQAPNSTSSSGNYSVIIYKCTSSFYTTKIQPKFTIGRNYTYSELLQLKADFTIGSVLVDSDTNVSRSELYNVLTSKGFTANQTNDALNGDSCILTFTTVLTDYPYCWIYIEKNK